ncbi:MAG: ATP-binding protein [Candidatus Sericytochromatia bacterium]|nr:ATP-binding protein [Candidatus Sericytochromatia bacterium]
MKNLPISTQTFKDLIEDNCLYVDKTKDIYKLLEGREKKFFFLSRPRRFGKSLLISTLEEIFLGNKELFKDLWIYDKYDFKKYPVIRIDFTAMVYADGIVGFKNSFFNKIKNIGLDYKIRLKSKDYKTAFQELIIKLSKIDKVVILIDEYDKPIVEYIEDSEIRNKMKDIIKDFYLVLKECDRYIKFAFLIGVSKFSKISLFSGLNNLIDLTLDPEYSTMLGYTQIELEYYFDDRIKLLAEKQNISVKDAKEDLKRWYNGYSWDGLNFVYNPFSILNVLKDKVINNYWFKSGTPTLLIKLIKDKDIDVRTLENFVASDALLDSFEIENINVPSLLFQTGYLTIKEIIEPNSPYREYILNYPNMEVKESLLNNILMGFANEDDSRIKINSLFKALNKNDLDGFFKFIFDIFTHIPNEIFMSDKERYYQTIIYLILTLIGVRIKVEIQTNIGRIDAVIETRDNIYIIEFKMNSVIQALNQINDNKYYESYLLSPKNIYLVGVSFDSNIRNIKDWHFEKLIR